MDTGISKINIETDIITSYDEFIVKDAFNYIEVNDILIAKNGDVLLATSQGINIYNEKQDTFKPILTYKQTIEIEKKLTSQDVYSLEEDSKGDIWVSTSNGVDKISENYKKIDCLYNDPNLNIKDIVHDLYYDKEGYIWGATYNSGLVKIDMKNNTIKNYVLENNEKSLPSNYISSILRDDHGTLWIGTNNGLVKYNEVSDDFTTYKSKNYYKNSLLDDEISTIIQVYSSSIWIGTNSGVSIFNPKDKFYNYSYDVLDNNSISSDKIKSIYEDESGFIWVATDKSYIDIIDRENDKIYHVNSFKDLYLSDNDVNYVTGSKDYIYIATKKGLIKINKKEDNIKIYTEDNGILSNNVTKLLLDSKGYLWIASEDGINILNTKDESILNLEDFIARNILSDKYVGDMFEDTEGNYYIGYSRHGGLVKISPSENKVKVYKYDENNKDTISSYSINSINEDYDGNIWIGTKNGLNKLANDSEKFIHYNSNEGLIDRNIHNVLIDKKNGIWVRNNRGISILNSETGFFSNMNLLNTLESNEFSKNAYYINKKGEFLIGGERGLNTFKPEDINTAEFKKNVVFDYFNVNGKEDKNIDNMKFRYDENNIDINFYLPSYKNNGMSTYRYKLDNGKNNSKWHKTNETKVSYNNLQPGNYIFTVTSSNYNEIVTDESTFNFTIKQPLWKSNIAKIIYISIVILILYINIKKVKKLNFLVTKTKNQLESETEVSEALLKNIIALEKNKNKCFVNLSYELRTPITLINGTVQLVNQINRMENGISTQKLNYHIDVVNKNCKRLLGVINNIIDSTKLENDSYIIKLEEKDIVYVVEEATLSLKDYVETKGIELVIDTDIEEKIINCDEIEIERCIVNLVDNARKFTPSGGCITVNIRDLNDKIEISVSDNGIGIDKDHQGNIFDRFSQVLDMKKDALKGGSGLGLTITKQIIKKHNGIIYLESEEGKGSKFIIILPTNL